jgi:hypothetical protein
MNSYCPSCFSDTMQIKSSGIVYVSINKKKLDSGQFVFNSSSGREDEIEEALRSEVERFFKWYSNFQNKDPISTYRFESSDFVCSNGCGVPLNMRFSVVDQLFSEETVEDVLHELGKKYGMKVELE